MTSAVSPPDIFLPADTEARLITRENRFLCRARVIRSEIPGIEAGVDIGVHVHDPGRLKELLFPGNALLLKWAPSPRRKTDWDLLAAHFRKNWVFIHSRYHRLLSERILASPAVNPLPPGGRVRAEVKLGHSRIDFLYTLPSGRRYAVEIKGCTLADDTGRALFPDAPTRRGARHLETLTECLTQGYESALIVLVFRPDAVCFSPFEARDPVFARLFYEAVEAGVSVYPMVFSFDGRRLEFLRRIPLCCNK